MLSGGLTKEWERRLTQISRWQTNFRLQGPGVIQVNHPDSFSAWIAAGSARPNSVLQDPIGTPQYQFMVFMGTAQNQRGWGWVTSHPAL